MPEFARPLALFALVLPPIAAWLALRERRRGQRRRRWAAALRAVGMSALILALAEPRLPRPVRRVAVSFVIDHSNSMPPAERTRADTLVASAIGAMPEGDRAAVVVFGEDALLDRAAREGEAVPIRSNPGGGRSNLAGALRLGQTALPADAGGRLVVLSDGRSNIGDLEDPIRLARARNIAIDVVPFRAALGEREVLISALNAPAVARVGQNVRVEAVVRAPRGGGGRLQIFDGDKVVVDQQVRVTDGGAPAVVGTTIEVDEPGFRRFRALLTPDEDQHAENNVSAAYTLVAGPPRVLIVTSEADRAAPLTSALRAAGRSPEVRAPEDTPSSLLTLAGYDAVVLVDVAAREVADDAEDALLAYVRDGGGGLVMIGGENSFGSGGWRHTAVEKALPVVMEVRDKERRPEIAIAYVIDKSGSMSSGAADPMGMGNSGGGLEQKLELAKQATMLSASLLQAQDRAGIVAFDGSSHLVWPMQPHAQPQDFDRAVLGLQIGGGTNIQAGLEAGLKELSSDDAPLRHLLLLSDGQSDSSGYDTLLKRMAEERITLTSVAIGAGASIEMEQLAQAGGGRYYPVLDHRDLPSIFVEDTMTALGTFVIEESFRPVPGARSPVLAGLEPSALPPLHGYNGVEARDSATVALWSHLEDPVLAHGQYGLGRSAAWMSDLKRQWAMDWVDSDAFGTFAVQLVDWVTPPPEDERLGLEASVNAGRARIALTAVDADGSPSSVLDTRAVLSGPDDRRIEVALAPAGAGRYEVDVELPAEGSWLLRVTALDAEGRTAGARTAGLVVPYSPEYADPSAEPVDPRLARLATETGGRVLAMEDLERSAFERVDGVTRPLALWPALVALAALLLPADIAARRLRIDRAAAMNALRAVIAAPLAGRARRRAARRGAAGAERGRSAGTSPGSPLGVPPGSREESPGFVGSAAEKRAIDEGGAAAGSTSDQDRSLGSTETRGTSGAAPGEPPDPRAASPDAAGSSSSSSPALEPAEEDTFSRLRRAKKRATRR